MYSRIDIGGKPVELTSNAATPRLYHKIFGADLLREFASMDTSTIKDSDSLEGIETLELVKQLAYVLNMQATRPFRDIYGKATEADYVEWLTGFEEEDFYNPDTLIDIISVWQKSARSSVQPKNATSPR